MGAAAFFSPEAAMADPILDPASFSVGVIPSCPTALECPPQQRGFLEQVDFTERFASVEVEAMTSPVGPIARVQGRIENTRSSLSIGEIAEAQLMYEVEVVPFGPGLARASAGGSAMASASVLNGAFRNPSIMACAGVTGCTNSPATSLSGFAAPNSPIAIILDARGGSTEEDGRTADLEACADPVLLIADGLIPGTERTSTIVTRSRSRSVPALRSRGARSGFRTATYALLRAG
jgi:hypothetical protein